MATERTVIGVIRGGCVVLECTTGFEPGDDGFGQLVHALFSLFDADELSFASVHGEPGDVALAGVQGDSE